MSATSNQLGKQAMEVTKDIREMGNIAKDAVEEGAVGSFRPITRLLRSRCFGRNG